MKRDNLFLKNSYPGKTKVASRYTISKIFQIYGREGFGNSFYENFGNWREMTGKLWCLITIIQAITDKYRFTFNNKNCLYTSYKWIRNRLCKPQCHATSLSILTNCYFEVSKINSCYFEAKKGKKVANLNPAISIFTCRILA